MPRAFSADLKSIRPFCSHRVGRQRRLGMNGSCPRHRCSTTHGDLGDYCYTRQKKCYMFVKSCLSSMSFCVGYRSAPGQDTGVDGCTTNRLCIASKPSQRPPLMMGCQVWEACCSHPPPSNVHSPNCWPRLQPCAQLSCVPKWRFISKHEVDYCSLALLPMRR